MPQIPVLALVAIVFALVLAATARNIHLGLAALVGGLVFGLLRGLGPVHTLCVAVSAVLDPDSLLLLVLVTSIMTLSAAMKNSGALADFTRAVAFVAPSKRASLTLTPLLIGTLPMPGGAMLSAPLVDALDPERRQGADGLSAINYWFRHILELAWPLYPAFILTSTISGIDGARLSLLNLYAPLTMLVLGQFFVIRHSELDDGSAQSGKLPGADRSSKKSGDLAGFLPIAILIGVFALLDPVCRAMAPTLGLEAGAKALFLRYVPIFGGVLSGATYVAIKAGGFAPFRKTLSAPVLKLAGIIAGIRAFSALLSAGGIADAGAAELASWGIPALAVAVILPLITGLVTGVGFAYVGIAFPIVLGLFPAGGTIPPEAAVVLAGAFGFTGMMLSPLHVCFVVTAGHFQTGLLPILRRFALPLGLYLAIAVAYVALLTKIL